MTQIESTFPRDANGVPITNLGLQVVKTMTFAGGTTNDPGDYDGTGNPATLFTITGDVMFNIVAVCKTSLAGANATIEVGVTDATAAIIPQITATDIDINMAVDIPIIAATPALAPYIFSHWHPIVGGLDVIQTVGTANITSGVIKYYGFWLPLSDDGNVVAA
jgi:hypothetical protein